MTLTIFVQLALMVFLLGIKHGIDPDHLVAIDGMTRYNAAAKPRLARWAGFLFSLGHGVVVVCFATFISTASTMHHVPQWAEAIGTLTSVTFLLAMGAVNLYGALCTSPHHPHAPMSFKRTLFDSFFKASSPLSILLLGALFAVSFDTLSQAAMFAATTSQSDEWQPATALALLFTVGMMLPDAVNGLWLSKMLRRANKDIQSVSRIMGAVIAGLSLTIGCINLGRFLSPTFSAHIESWQMLISAALVMVTAIGIPTMLYVRRRHPTVYGDSHPSTARQNGGPKCINRD